MMDNLSYWLAAFAAERYSYISRGKTANALSIFTKLLEQPPNPGYKSSCESRAEFLLEYIKSRAIYYRRQ